MIVVRQGQRAKCRGGNFCRYQRIYREKYVDAVRKHCLNLICLGIVDRLRRMYKRMHTVGMHEYTGFDHERSLPGAQSMGLRSSTLLSSELLGTKQTFSTHVRPLKGKSRA